MIELGMATAEMMVGRERRKKYINMPKPTSTPRSRIGFTASEPPGTRAPSASAASAMSTRGAVPSLHFAASHEPTANKSTNASTLTWNDGTRATLSSNPNSRKYTASVAPTSASASLTFGDDRKNQTIS